MALSNWDTMAFDENGDATNGVAEFPNGFTLRIYKNWCYVGSEKMWNDDVGYIYPTIMEIHEGFVCISNVTITAIRGPQDSIFLYADKITSEGKKVIAGIGAYGYDDGEWVGITQETFYAFISWLESMFKESYYFSAAKEKLEAWMKKIKENAARFNQGDAYFADKFGEEIPSSKVGEQEEPVFTKIIKEKFGEKSEYGG